MLSTTAAALGVMAWTLADPTLTHELEIQIGVFCVGLFLACMFCHGELVRSQALAALAHPLLPDDLGRAAPSARCWSASSRRSCCPATSSCRPGWCCARCCCSGRCAATTRSTACSALVGAGRDDRLRDLGRDRVLRGHDHASSRNFYGVLRVQEVGARRANRRRSLIHGTILHGNQYLDPVLRRQATTYYTRDLGHRAAARVAAPAPRAAAGRRDRPRHRHRSRPTARRATCTASTRSTRT